MHNSRTFNKCKESCNHHHHYPLLGIFHHKDSSCPFFDNPVTRSNPRKPLIYFLSLQICLFYVFNINGIKIYRAYIWLLSPTDVFNVHQSCSIHNSSSSLLNSIPLGDCATVCFSINQSMNIWIVSPFWLL